MSTTLAAMHAALEALDINPGSALRSGAVRVAPDHTPGNGNGTARPGITATPPAPTTGVKSPRLIVRRPSSAPTTTVKEKFIVNTQTPSPNGLASGTPESPEQELARLKAENAALRARQEKASTLSLRVSEKGAVSVYGLGRFPVTQYKEQWLRILAIADEIRAFITAHDRELKSKGD